MSKFKRVLSDEFIDSVVNNSPFTLGQSISRSKDFIMMIEQAVLEKLAEQADMFWDLDNPEWSRESISQILLEDRGFDQADVGKTVELMRAKSLPNISVLITSYDEDEGQITWRVIEND